MKSAVNPIVSIIMATFNRAHLITETLESIRYQSFEDWECLIIDDGSSDETEILVRTFLDLDQRFKYFRRGSDHLKGLPGCRNDGLDRAKGEFVIFFDDDDIVHPRNLEFCVYELDNTGFNFCRYEREVFTGSFFRPFDLKPGYRKEVLGKEQLEKIVVGEIPFNSCQVMWRKDCFEKIRFNETLMYAEEWECYLRILAKGITGVNIKKVLFFGRKHAQSNTGEFWNNDPVRRKSKIMATELVIKNLKKNDLLSPKLKRYFIQLGIFLKEKSIVHFVMQQTKTSRLGRIKYSLLYNFYPIIAVGHRMRKKLRPSFF